MESPEREYRVLTLDDHPMVLDGISHLLSTQQGLSCRGVTSTPEMVEVLERVVERPARILQGYRETLAYQLVATVGLHGNLAVKWRVEVERAAQEAVDALHLHAQARACGGVSRLREVERTAVLTGMVECLGGTDIENVGLAPAHGGVPRGGTIIVRRSRHRALYVARSHYDRSCQ